MFANEQRRVVTDYGADPNNPAAWVVRDAFLRVWGFLVPYVGGGSADPKGQFHGVGPMLQDFTGAANPAATTIVNRDGEFPSIQHGASDPDDPVRRVFADRLRRRSAR